MDESLNAVSQKDRNDIENELFKDTSKTYVYIFCCEVYFFKYIKTQGISLCYSARIEMKNILITAWAILSWSLIRVILQ